MKRKPRRGRPSHPRRRAKASPTTDAHEGGLSAESTGGPHPHLSVLLDAVLEAFAVHPLRRVIDGTVGAGGHSHGVLSRFPDAELLAIDRDPKAVELAHARLAEFGARATVVLSRYGDFPAAMAARGWADFDGLLLDIGVSSMQLDSAEYGMAFSIEAPLDMRMGPDGPGALELIDSSTEEELADAIFKYGEERLSRRIAKQIKIARREGALETTTDLATVCAGCYPKGYQRIHPATRTFQALRIAVNNELGELEAALSAIPKFVAPEAIIQVISFHSIEDRIVKVAFREWAEQGKGRILTKKPKTADEAEALRNPRSRSAKLRAFHWGATRPDPLSKRTPKHPPA